MNSSRRAVPMVGRQEELDTLLAALRSEQPTPLLIGGDAGVGKTRLVGELRTLAEQQGFRVLHGHCIDFGDAAAPYLPFVEIFGRAADSADPGGGAVDPDASPAIPRWPG